MAFVAISLIGPQGCGKSTQIKAMEVNGFQTVTMSEVIGAAMHSDRHFASLAARYMSRGLLVPTRFVMPILWPHLDEMARKAEESGRDLQIILDGVPRCRKQALILEERYFKPKNFQRAYVFLHLSFDEAQERIRRRVQQMLDAGKQPRKDDCDEQAVRERLGAYFKNHSKLMRYFQKIGANVCQVDARLRQDQVTQQILDGVRVVSCAA